MDRGHGAKQSVKSQELERTYSWYRPEERSYSWYDCERPYSWCRQISLIRQPRGGLSGG